MDTQTLRKYADVCDCGDKPHWASAMRWAGLIEKLEGYGKHGERKKMAFVTEEIEHDDLPVRLMTAASDKESGECREPWRFISLEFDQFENLTPPELRRLGRWLVQEGKRIGKEYKSNGAMKTPSNAEVSGTGTASAGLPG